jgi:hypothetical protein
MNNKYNLDYYETMDVANEYLDRIEDELNIVLNKYKGDSEKLEEALNKVKNNFEPILHSEDMLYLYLDSGDYQSVCNQLVMREMLNIFYRDAIPEQDLGYISDYLEEISERQLIEDVTDLIDGFIKDNQEVR